MIRYIEVATVTLDRLRKLGSQALDLYVFYYQCADAQKTNQPFATNRWTAQQLGWGETKLERWKKILVDNNFIKIVQGRKNKGEWGKFYVRVSFWNNTGNKKGTPVQRDPATAGPRLTGDNSYNITYALDKKTILEKISSSKKSTTPVGVEYSLYTNDTDKKCEHLRESWKKLFANTPEIGGHKRLESRVRIVTKGKGGDILEYSLYELLVEALKQHTVEELIASFKNYKTVLEGEDYFCPYKWKNLGSFIHAGLYKGTGFKNFLSSDQLERYVDRRDPLQHILDNYTPISSSYDKANPFSKERYTYYGFKVEDFDVELKQKIQSTIIAVEWRERKNLPLKKYTFVTLEFCIAAILWKKNKGEITYNNYLETLFKLWNKFKDKECE